jgi:NAD(P)-dependent dehydrogenase (short-subunit alcohol dehydrogenase family)
MKESTLQLDGKVALVTGASKGIGKAIALAFAGAGAQIAACSRGSVSGQLEAVAAEIKTLGRSSLAIQADTGKKEEVDRMVETTLDNFGRIDILVNNAGILIRSSLLSITESDWDTLMAVDLKGFFLCSQAVGRIMRDQAGGNIINISTQHAFKAMGNEFGPYGVAKAGVVMMTRYLAKELGDCGVRVNGIAPGLTRTDFSKKTWSNPEVLKQVEAGLPLKRMAEVDEIADAALFLASDASRYVTGQTILMEGGSLA